MTEPKYGYALHVSVRFAEKEVEVTPKSPIEDIRECMREHLEYRCGTEGMGEELTNDAEATDDFVERATQAFQKMGWDRTRRNDSLGVFSLELVYVMTFEVIDSPDSGEYDAHCDILTVTTGIQFSQFLAEKAAELPKWKPFKQEIDKAK